MDQLATQSTMHTETVFKFRVPNDTATFLLLYEIKII